MQSNFHKQTNFYVNKVGVIWCGVLDSGYKNILICNFIKRVEMWFKYNNFEKWNVFLLDYCRDIFGNEFYFSQTFIYNDLSKTNLDEICEDCKMK